MSSEHSPLLDPLGYDANKRPRYQSRLRVALALALFSMFGAAMYFFTVQIPRMQTARPVPDLVRVAALDEQYWPDFNSKSKLMLVGDVHGSYSELKHLLKKVGYKKNRDHLVLLGDFITKGPNSIDVLDLAIDLGASCVRGNHEHDILQMYAEYHHLPPPGIDGLTSNLSTANLSIPDSVSTSRLDESDDDDLVRLLKPRHIRYLGSCPAILRLGDSFARGYDAIGVHGGLMWNVDDLDHQDPEVVMSIRTVLPPRYTIPSAEGDGRHWSELWNEKQESLPNKKRMVAYYGHDARNGLNIKDFTKGLDTGCVKGGELTAMVISESKKGHYKEKLVSVDC